MHADIERDALIYIRELVGHLAEFTVNHIDQLECNCCRETLQPIGDYARTTSQDVTAVLEWLDLVNVEPTRRVTYSDGGPVYTRNADTGGDVLMPPACLAGKPRLRGGDYIA